jgi:hypothetical protein
MKKSLQAFLRGLIDYAGLFPPAKLSLHEAIHNYAYYKKNADSWMLSRFIIPASRFEELSAYGDELSASDSHFDFSVTGGATQTVEDFHAEIDTLCQNCIQFCSKHGSLFHTPAAEIKLPAEAVSSQDRKQLQQLMDHAAEQLNSSLQTPKIIFYENLLSEHWKQEIDATIQAISEHKQKIDQGASDYQFAGYKLRCGGVKAHLFPSIEQVASVINKARDYEIPMKVTAGLHHPVRHFAESVQTKMHGFFNVFGGALLSHANDLSENQLQLILREEDPQQFIFTDETFRWKDYAISTNEINHLRKTMLVSYGSCNFDEPREDLRQLNLL